MAYDIPNYDRWKLASGLEEKEVVACECEYCGGEIYEGEQVIDTSDGTVHEECFDEFAKEVLDFKYITAER
jgi:hypothetical protein